jgi:lysyl-tRNA synthetase class 2
MENNLSEEQIRLEKLVNLIKNNVNPYPAKCNRLNFASQAKTADNDTKVCLTGRLLSKREMGKLCFGHLKDFSGKIQLAISEKELGKENYKFFLKNFDVGDFTEVSGVIFTTHKGEISVLVKEYKMLSKALLPLPEKFHGLTDIEARYRQRFLDLIANKKSMEIAVIRSKLVKEIRRYFDERDFFEVETPI